MMDKKSIIKSLNIDGMTYADQKQILADIEQSIKDSQSRQKDLLKSNVDFVVQALEQIKNDLNIRFNVLNKHLEEKGNQMIEGKAGKDGKDGRPGKDGKPGRDGSIGPAGAKGKDGQDGIGISNAKIDIDGELVITLTDGRKIEAGKVLSKGAAEKIRVFSNANIVIPDQTGKSGQFLTTNGTDLSWANLVTGLDYQGTWNASTNTPALESGVGTNGYYYVVSVSGSTNLDGVSDWVAGDWAIFNGATWQKIDQTNLVTSVNSQTGAVNLTASDVGAATSAQGALADSAVQPGDNVSDLTNDAGYLTSETYTGTVTSVSTGTGLTGGPITSSGTIALANTAVTAGSYTNADITVDAQGRITAASSGSGGGIAEFTGAESTSSPNATVYVDSLTASAASTNADVAFVAKGTGATLAQVPTGTTAGGNKRGTYATDWQKSRSSVLHVAGASYSTIIGGLNNTSSNDSSIAGGNGSIASGSNASVAFGNVATASGFSSVALGFGSTASGSFGSVALGSYGNTKFRASSLALGCVGISGLYGGNTQMVMMPLSVKTTDATPSELLAYPLASNSYRFALANNSAITFKILIIATVTAGGDTKAWEVTGAMKRGANAASTSVVGTISKTVVAADSGASTWNIDVTANTSAGALYIQATGEAGRTIQWQAAVYAAEIAF